MKLITVISLLTLFLVSCSPSEEEKRSLPKASSHTLRGRQLVQSLGTCGYCHGERRSPDADLSGGQTIHDGYGTLSAPNITSHSTGVADWTVDDVINALRLSKGKDGDSLSPGAHRGYEWMSDADLVSVVAYLRSVKPVDSRVSRRKVSFAKKSTTGLFVDGAGVATGFVPEIGKRHKIAYGKYLVDHVARCGRCHSSDPGALLDDGYLKGGEIKDQEKNVVETPPIYGDGDGGLSDWTTLEIATYLLTGKRRGKEKLDSPHCPVDFYAKANPSDLGAMAVYLKTVKPE